MKRGMIASTRVGFTKNKYSFFIILKIHSQFYPQAKTNVYGKVQLGWMNIKKRVEWINWRMTSQKKHTLHHFFIKI